jgi:PAP2 superfamily
VRLAIHANRHAAFAHAAQLWQAERRMHLRIEPWLNGLAAARPALAEAAGYYYGLLHFLVTPVLLAWLYWRRPAAFGRRRSALVLATTAANVVFLVWPAAPPRFAVPGMTDILVTHDILGAADPHGATSLMDLYAAMPSLHVAWAAWCATAIVITTRSRWRHLAWMGVDVAAAQPGADLVEYTAGVGGAVDVVGLLVVHVGPPRRP